MLEVDWIVFFDMFVVCGCVCIEVVCEVLGMFGKLVVMLLVCFVVKCCV